MTRRSRSSIPTRSTRVTCRTATFCLPSALTARATSANQTSPAYAAVSGAPLTLLSWAGPTTSEPIQLGFRQPIGATDILRAGSYAKALTFTLSTTTP